MSENKFSENLKMHRKRLGMTQNQFAEYCGIYGAQVSQFERGINPSISTLQLLCDALKVSATELLGF